MKRVGLTGGIGSGKTTVAKLFELFNVPVYYADLRARRLTNSHPEIIRQVKNLFGSDIYIQGCLDREKVAGAVFSDRELLGKLSSIIHPIVKSDFDAWCSEHSKSPLIVQEAAILFENGSYHLFDKMILVTAPVELRVQRVVQRDQVGRDAILDRMKNQWDDKQKEQLADYVIKCDERHLVLKQVMKIINDIQVWEL